MTLMKALGGCSVRRWLAALLALGLLSVGLLSYRMASLSSLSLPRFRDFRRNPRPRMSPPTYMLVRAIGNALPPRHDPARALENLRFTLEHEQLEDTELATHWVLNRLADEKVARQFRDLLTEFGAEFTELPLDLEEYAHASFHAVIEDRGVDQVHIENTGEDLWTKNQNINAVYGSKNRYALGINTARNFMLDIARNSGARWLLPWDQACFLTREAWEQIKRDLDNASPDQKYFLSFMDRLQDKNDVIFTPGFKANPWEEPQIIFRNDSIERFDEQLRYGQRDKAALLVRLQVSGVWDGWGWSSWEQRHTYANVSKDVTGPEAVSSTGYVLRLYSGLTSSAEANRPSAGYWREIRRAKGVIALLNTLEERVMREVYDYHSNKFLIYNETLLQKFKEKTGIDEDNELISSLINDADHARLVSKPWTITSNEALDPKRDPRVFSNFFDHKSEVLGDGEIIREMAYNTTALALAWRLTDNNQYAEQAAAFLDVWCADTTIAMRTTLEYADMSYQKLLTSKGNSTRGSLMGIRHTAVIPMLLDAVRLLNSTNSNSTSEGVLPHELGDKIIIWAQELYDSLQSSYARDTFRLSPGLFALLYDVQVAALAAFLDNPNALRFTLGTMQGRLITMISPEEKLLVPTGVATKPYTLLMLATWGFAVDLAEHFGLASQLFHFDLMPTRREERVNKEGGLLCRFIGHTVPCCQAKVTNANVGHQCMTALQHADEAQLLVYSRIVRRAVEHCPILLKRPSCASLARVQPNLAALSAHEMSRYLLPSYYFLSSAM
ncbi:hypothetical protein L914_16583 [Phytophthora nicotianae]|uniref:Alginate lyase domain-containing protein n=2 Tax=Phytophthora nicotianae TaxID=4792 RepID=V9EF60_PHYNI|nr:hypothetical protein F443_17208 [Phytophthora nicotianae P1569]ETM36778.1 hypothetical protein L914_16583 [Phytophthora nicotianae]